MARIAVLLILALLAGGCGKLSLPFGKVKPPETTVPAPAEAPKPSELRAESLFPASDAHLTFSVADEGQPAVRVDEEWIREGDRVAMTQNGALYAVWELREDGVWRLDPRGGGALLRYLPAVLQDGMAWRQSSGGMEIWFLLTEAPGRCGGGQSQPVPEHCWQLRVFNRGEVTSFLFGTGAGAVSAEAVNHVRPADSFVKTPTGRAGSKLTPAQRKALVDRAAGVRGEPARVSSGTPEEFKQAVDRVALQKDGALRLDLNGDGKDDVIRGPLNTWTHKPVEVFAAEGALLGVLAGGDQHVSVVYIPGVRRPVFQQRMRSANGPETFRLVAVVREPGMQRDELRPIGPGERTTTTAFANRVMIDGSGKLTLEWDMGDPARHTRVTRYRVEENGGSLRVVEESVSYVPHGKELAWPKNPEELLLAAFIANWYGLGTELNGYFTDRAQAGAFAADKRIGSPPDYTPGKVTMGRAEAEKGDCGPKLAPAAGKVGESMAFSARWGGNEWRACAWGQVTFGTDQKGRPVITSLKVEGGEFGGH